MRRRRPAVLATIVAIAAPSLFAAACASNSPSSSSASNSGNQSTRAQLQQDAVAFSGCMRSHRVPNFPDPTTSPRDFKQALDPSVTHSPAFQPAYAACHHLLPGGGPPNQSPAHSQAQIAAFLAFARCIRGHGFPNFPDPTGAGELTHEMVASAGIDLHQPAVLQAGDACVSVAHGFITETDVARFVAGQ